MVLLAALAAAVLATPLGDGDSVAGAPGAVHRSAGAPASAPVPHGRPGSGTTPSPPGAEPPQPPRHVIAVQGATAPEPTYVLVTWDRDDPRATGYEILRDGRLAGRRHVRGDAWNDAVWRDRDAAPGVHRYRVRALSNGRAGPASPPYAVRVRAAGDLGAVFAVDAYAGTDTQRAQAAIAAARRAGGGVVAFGPRTYTLDRPLLVSAADAVLLRGAGAGRTILQPSFPGAASPCGIASNLIVFRGRLVDSGARAPAGIAVGARTVTLSGPRPLRRGDVVEFDEAPPQRNPATFAQAGVIEDPGTGRDRRNAWEANEVMAVKGSAVTFRYPFGQDFTAEVRPQLLERGRGGGIESMTLQGRGPDEPTNYQLVQLDDVAHVTVADVEMRWANRNFLQINGYDIRVVGLRGFDGGAASFDGGSCRYKLSVFRAANVLVADAVMGKPGTDDNQSFITVQRAQRVVVRAGSFYGSRTYALNEHGGSSRGLVFENNRLAAGPRAQFGAILLGNSSWGYSGPAIVRNNLFVGNSRDLLLQENSYEVRFLDNVSRGSVVSSVEGYGWAGPDTQPELRGSLRLTIAGNEILAGQGDGFVLGGPESPWFPYPGVRDVVVSGNAVDVAGVALWLKGTSADSSRFQVSGNAGLRPVRVPRLTADSYWADNGDGRRVGSPQPVAWSTDAFAWEAFDRGSRADP